MQGSQVGGACTAVPDALCLVGFVRSGRLLHLEHSCSQVWLQHSRMDAARWTAEWTAEASGLKRSDSGGPGFSPALRRPLPLRLALPLPLPLLLSWGASWHVAASAPQQGTSMPAISALSGKLATSRRPPRMTRAASTRGAAAQIDWLSTSPASVWQAAVVLGR